MRATKKSGAVLNLFELTLTPFLGFYDFMMAGDKEKYIYENKKDY